MAIGGKVEHGQAAQLPGGDMGRRRDVGEHGQLQAR